MSSNKYNNSLKDNLNSKNCTTSNLNEKKESKRIIKPKNLSQELEQEKIINKKITVSNFKGNYTTNTRDKSLKKDASNSNPHEIDNFKTNKTNKSMTVEGSTTKVKSN